MNRIFRNHSILSLVLAIVLIAAMALTFVSCDNDTASDATESSTVTTTGNTEPTETVVGEGDTSFAFNVKFADGTMRSYIVKTDKEIVGDALVDAGLISGSEGPYGLMVEAVCGVALDYNADKMYWSFNINGEYAMTGVDGTEIDADSVYSFEATKA